MYMNLGSMVLPGIVKSDLGVLNWRPQDDCRVHVARLDGSEVCAVLLCRSPSNHSNLVHLVIKCECRALTAGPGSHMLSRHWCMMSADVHLLQCQWTAEAVHSFQQSAWLNTTRCVRAVLYPFKSTHVYAFALFCQHSHRVPLRHLHSTAIIMAMLLRRRAPMDTQHCTWTWRRLMTHRSCMTCLWSH